MDKRAGVLKEGLDYYKDELGRFVFTDHYHLERGYCCKSGCRHCPFGFDDNEKPSDSKAENKSSK
jgi:hypothetical protein